MQSERKTQIYLTEVEHRGLKRRAAAEGRSMASVVREAVATYLSSPGRGSRAFADPLLGLAGIAGGRPKDSASVDDVLYGKRP